MSKNNSDYKDSRDNFYRELTIRRARKGQDYFGLPSGHIYNRNSVGNINDNTSSWKANPDDDYYHEKRKTAIIVGLIIITILLCSALRNKSAKQKYFVENGNIKKIVLEQNEQTESFARCYYLKDNIKMYKSKYIYFLLSKDKTEVIPYIILDAREFENTDVGEEIFDIETEELLAYEKCHIDLFEDRFEGRQYYEYLNRNYTWIPLTDISQYLGYPIEIKEAYTKEELVPFESILICSEDQAKIMKKSIQI